MRNTKILVTLGPCAEDERVLADLMLAGMNVARLNFSHGDFVEHGVRIQRIKKLREDLDRPVSLLLDTKRPEIRTGEVIDDLIRLTTGERVTLTTDSVLGTTELISVSFEQLPQRVQPGSTVLLDDGLIKLRVVEIPDERHVVCEIENGGTIKSRRSVNVPHLHLNLPNPTPKDEEDIRFAAAQGFDYVAVSFTESVQTIERVREILADQGAFDVKVIAKIENHGGLHHADEIIDAADGIMVARGDLGVELEPEEVPIVQKELIRRCYMAGKPVITATQMLHSMIDSSQPTRAEVSDIANAVYDFTSAIMLSGETSVGKHPVECVKVMDRIARRTEEAINYRGTFFALSAAHTALHDTANAITHAAIATAFHVGARAIVVVTESGRSARMLSRMRPGIPIIAVVFDDRVYRQLAMNWGVFPVRGGTYRSLDDVYVNSVRLAAETGLVNQGDKVVLVAGIPVGKTGATNMIKVEQVGSARDEVPQNEPTNQIPFRPHLLRRAEDRLSQAGRAGGSSLHTLDFLRGPIGNRAKAG